MNNLPARIRGILPKGRFARGVTVLVGGTALGQALSVLASPLLTRLYQPEDFGVLAVYAAVVGIFAVVSALRYELAIPLPDDDRAASDLLRLSLALVLIVTLLVGVTVRLFGAHFTAWANAPGLAPYLWLIPLGVLGAGTYQTFTYWATRKQAFSSIARTKLAQGVAQVSVQLGLGFFSLGPFGLMLGQVIGQTAGTATLARLAWRQPGHERPKLATLQQVAWRYRRFPLFSSWSGIFNVLSAQVPVLLLAFFFGPLVTGLYALGQRVLQLPLTLVGQAVSQVFYAAAAESKRGERLRELTDDVFGRLVHIGLPLMLLIGVAAPEVFAVVFGEAWRQAGIYAQYLAPWLFVVFVSSPLSILPSLLERQGTELLFQSSLLTARIAALSLGGWLADPTLAVALFGAAGVLCWSMFMFWNMQLSGNPPLRVVRRLMAALIRALPVTLPVLIVKLLTEHDLLVVLTAAASGLYLSRNALAAVRGVT